MIYKTVVHIRGCVN